MPLPSKMPAGTLQLLGLGGIQAVLGERWMERSDQIHRLIEGVLRRKLDVTDAFYRVDEENYLILFTRLGRREAEFKARVISEEIEKLIIGELPAGQSVVVSSNVTEVDRGVVLEKIQSLDELVEYVRAATGPEFEDGNVTLFGDVGAESTEPAKSAAVGAGPDLADLDQSLSGLFQKKSVAAFLKECQVGFYPAFSIKRRNFSIYHSSVVHVPTGKAADAVNDPFLENPEELSFQLDRYTLTAGLLGVHRMLTSGRRGIVIMSASYETLATSKLRDVYFARLKEVPAGISKFLGIAVQNIPSGTPASRIAEVMAYVQPFFATRVLHVPPDFRLIDIYSGTGCHTFSTWIPVEEIDQNHRMQILSIFAKRAALHRMESVLVNASSHDDVSLGVAAGFTFISGDAVAPITETPGMAKKLKAEHILQQIGGSSSA
ncbi:MAG TPA: hypothetical protein VF194_07520 [Ferrovibrio sp.]|uniref:hypothetical protein n=1 Tax=Ferrovibrio sp. TaxID=1917215 RepID=UPI002ED07F29